MKPASSAEPACPTSDFFALLGLPRQPWIEPEAMQARFFEVSREVHPDRFHQAAEAERTSAHQRYVEINTAYQCLREPKDRLFHLLTLERGATPSRTLHVVPPEVERWFGSVADHLRQCDAFLKHNRHSLPPLLQARRLEQSFEWTERLAQVRDDLTTREDAIADELKGLNRLWTEAPPPGHPARLEALPLRRLAELRLALGFFTRWKGQIQERLFQLTQLGFLKPLPGQPGNVGGQDSGGNISYQRRR